jgi:methionine sulfoxide reductase heme-binding subunit
MRGPLPWLKPAVFLGSLMPLAALGIRAWRGTLSADPIAYVLNQLGLLTLIFLIATLTLTPLRKLFGWTWPIRIRRMLGLFTFFYATLHITTYAAVDQRFDWGTILEDITKRQFIFVGFAAWLLLIPLAITSTNGMVRRLGPARWQRLHRLVYVAATLGVVHFIWRVKRDLTEPAIYGAVLAALLLFRVVDAVRTRGKKQAKEALRAGSRVDAAAAASPAASIPPHE